MGSKVMPNLSYMDLREKPRRPVNPNVTQQTQVPTTYTPN